MSSSHGSSARVWSITAKQSARAGARGVQAAQDDVADLDLVAVVERVEGVLASAAGWIETGMSCSSREPAVAGDVVSVRVRLQHAHDADTAAVRLREVLLDLVRRIDDDRRGRVLVADEVRRAAEIVVDELREDHAAKLAATSAISLEVP